MFTHREKCSHLNIFWIISSSFVICRQIYHKAGETTVKTGFTQFSQRHWLGACTIKISTEKISTSEIYFIILLGTCKYYTISLLSSKFGPYLITYTCNPMIDQAGLSFICSPVINQIDLTLTWCPMLLSLICSPVINQADFTLTWYSILLIKWSTKLNLVNT